MTAYREVIQDIGGLILGMDAKTVTQVPRVVAGANFLFDTLGVKSGWGSAQLTDEPIEDMRRTALLPCVDAVIVATLSGILDTNLVELLALTPTDPSYSDAPWSHTHVTDYYIYAHPALGTQLATYHTLTDTWAVVDLVTQGFASPIISVTQSQGRLVVLASDTVSWSVVDYPFDFDVSHTHGAGYQSLTAFNCGLSLTLLGTETGFLVVSQLGILEARIIADISLVYRFSILASELTALNPWAVVKLPDMSHIILTSAGFYQVTVGGQVGLTPWQPLMSRYIVESLLRGIIYQDAKLWYCHELACLFLQTFEGILVYQFRYDKWCNIQQAIDSFGETGERKLSNTFGFISTEGHIHRFDGSNVVDSWILVPIMRTHPEAQRYTDSFIYVTDVTLGKPDSVPTQVSYPELGQPLQSFPYDKAYATTFSAFIKSSLDSYSQFENEEQALSAVRDTPRATYYKCSINSIYPLLLITAKEVDEYIHITRIEVCGDYKGMRLY